MEGAEKLLGLRDQPIDNREQETLGLGEYAEVLTEFVRRCDTPLTIALQGDWGSGKTSLMTLIRNELKEKDKDEERYLTVWFNTWQYAQFNMENTLALSMMSKITDELSRGHHNDAIRTLKRGLWAATRAVTIGSASLIGQADTVKEIVDEAERAGGGVNAEDPATALERIKDGLTEIVKDRTKDSNKKIVVFIDDLDRLVPERAVELLEAMKIFLDIDRCVYVIACDYSVVAAGLEAKFGLSEGQLKGKNFFDKIIQVPFKMPTRRYQVNEYIKRLLTQIGVDYDSARDIDMYCDLVEHSVGFNPRTMKRLLNTLQLLTILEDKRRQERKASETEATEIDDKERRRHACRVTFAILCMLERYEAIYDYLTKEPLSPERLASLHEGLRESKEFDGLRRKIAGKMDADAGDHMEENIDGEAIASAVDFVDTFIDCLQLDEDERLSNDEVRHLQEMLSQSALVSAGRQLRDFVPREFAFELRSDLNRRYNDFVRGSRPKYGKFRIRDGEVYLSPSSGVAKLCMGRYDETYYFAIYPKNHGDKVSGLGDLICEKMGWDRGKVLEEENGYLFFEQDSTVQGAEEQYKNELFRRLDALTKPRNKLYHLFEDARD